MLACALCTLVHERAKEQRRKLAANSTKCGHTLTQHYSNQPETVIPSASHADSLGWEIFAPDVTNNLKNGNEAVFVVKIVVSVVIMHHI